MGSIGQKSTFFQNSINTNQQRHLYRAMRGSRFFLSGGGGGGGGGGGVQAPQHILQYITEGGGPMFFFTHFPGGSNFFQGGGGGQNANFYRTHITTTCYFPGDPLPPPLWIRTWAMWNLGTNLCGLLLRLETPNANLSIVFKRLAKALIRLRICAGWSKPLVLAHTTLLEIAAHLLVQKCITAVYQDEIVFVS